MLIRRLIIIGQPWSVLILACSGAANESTSSSRSDSGAEGVEASTIPVDGDAGVSANLYPGEQPQTAFVSFLFPFSGIEQNTLGATFVVSRDKDPCETRVTDSCRVRVCPRIAGRPIGREVDYTYTSAGEVRVSGGSPTLSLSATPAPNDFYEFVSAPRSSPPQFLGGEDVRFQALGGKLVTFDVVHKFPVVLYLETPSDPSMKISRNQDLTLVWSRGTSDVGMWLLATAGEKDSPVTIVTCRFLSAGGQGTVPQSVLATLTTKTDLMLYTVGLRTIQQADFNTTLAVATDVLTPTKLPVRLVVE